MEPHELAKNDEGSGFFKRRISSILKAPRKSARFPDPEQQENTVECAIPVEKRNSRRVSFAPANDVLLFSKEVKNTSPVRNPLQELISATGAASQNRVPVAFAEDGIHQMLAAGSLHSSQKQDRVSFDTVKDFGEKTVVFSTDDAFMDMTHSQTMNLASYADISLLHCDAGPTGGEKTVMFTVDDASMDMTLNHTVNMTTGFLSLPTGRKMVDLNVEKRNVPGSAPSLDLGFENFLASLSKPVGPTSSAETCGPVTHIKTQTPKVDKENQLPTSLPAVMRKSLSSSRKCTESPFGSVLGPEEDDSMNLTEVQTGRILGFTEDPFQGLFSSQDMRVHSDKTVSQTAAMMKTKADPKEVASMKNPSLKSTHPTRKVNVDARDDYVEKTIRFSSEEFMDMTQSHTVNIARAPQQVSDPDGLDSGFKNLLAGLSKPTGSARNINTPNCSLSQLKKTTSADVAEDGPWLDTTQSSPGCETDVGMDMTAAQTGHIIEMATSDDPFGFLFSSQDTYPHGEGLKMSFGQKNTESLELSLHQENSASEFDHRKGAAMAPADETFMDVTRSHTVHIGTDFKLGFLPPCRDKTVRFNANDAGMDMTQCLTVNIANNLESESALLLSTAKKQEGEKRGPPGVRFSSAPGLEPKCANGVPPTAAAPSNCRDSDTICPDEEEEEEDDGEDVSMDMTEAQTGRILGMTHSEDSLRCLFPSRDAYPQIDHLKEAEPSVKVPETSAYAGAEKSWSETSLRDREECTDDAATKVTRCLGVKSGRKSAPFSLPPRPQSNTLSTHDQVDFLTLPVKKKERNGSLSARGAFDPGFGNSLSGTREGPWVNPAVTKAVTPGVHHARPLVLKHHVDPGNEAAGFVTEELQNETVTQNVPECNVSMEMTEAQTAHIFGGTCAEELPPCLSPTQEPEPDLRLEKKREDTSQQSNGAAGARDPECVEIANVPEFVDLHKIVTREESEATSETSSLWRKMESSPSVVEREADGASCSRQSRRMSLADLKSKARRLSHMIKAAPETFTVESRTAPLPQWDQDQEVDKAKSLPGVETEPEMSLESTQVKIREEEEKEAPATPFNLKTKHLMSRLSVGGFKAKLPQRSNASDPKKAEPAGEPARAAPLSNLDGSDIFDEELESCEEVTETLEPKSPQKTREEEKKSPLQEAPIVGETEAEDEVWEEERVQGKKRRLPTEEMEMEDEKRKKASTGVFEMEFQEEFQSRSEERDANVTTAPHTSTHTTDCSSNSQTASIRYETTFESTFKQSLFESQLEDYASDAQKKLEDGTITVLEFFKLFSIDFVIHNPRQSVRPGRLLSDTDPTAMEVLKDRHISRPKQMVYEANVQNLTEKVESLKVRMRDLDRPLRTVNKPLWEEMRNYCEKELKSFGANLKERNNYFRKMSKARSHEMKEVLYSDLVQTHLEEHQKLRGTITQADEMIKSLDECICELESELAAVEEKGFEDKPSLRSLREETKKVTDARADNDRQIAELELQKKQNSTQLNRLKAERTNLETHVTVLNMVNEWKFGEKTDNCTTYTFLHGTMHLRVVYKKSKGADAAEESERKITKITFSLQLDDERSQGHARLVHTLLSHYIESQTSWEEKYPTSRHVSKLLHDVGLVVSRCRLLGEELRLLKLWGGLRLDILDIGCVDTQVHIVFSSLRKTSKFEVVFSVGVVDHACDLQVESCKSVIGNTEVRQIKDIVASFSPTKNLLTKIVKKIHENLLC